MTFRPLVALAALSLAACAPALIPGTNVEDTRGSREVYGVIKAYAEALQRKDAPAVLALVAPDYFDSAGTPTPDDDMDRAALERSLATDLAKVDSFKVQIGVKAIAVNAEQTQAQAQLYYDGYFRVITPNGPVAKRESDLHQMTFRKIGLDWKITSGL